MGPCQRPGHSKLPQAAEAVHVVALSTEQHDSRKTCTIRKKHVHNTGSIASYFSYCRTSNKQYSGIYISMIRSNPRTPLDVPLTQEKFTSYLHLIWVAARYSEHPTIYYLRRNLAKEVNREVSPVLTCRGALFTGFYTERYGSAPVSQLLFKPPLNLLYEYEFIYPFLWALYILRLPIRE